MRANSPKTLLALFVALVSGALVAEVMKEGVLKKVDYAFLTAEVDSETKISLNFGVRDQDSGVFYGNGALHALIFPGRIKKIEFHNNQLLGNALQFVLQSPTVMTVVQLGLYNAHSDKWILLQGQELLDALGTTTGGISARLVGDKVEITNPKHRGRANLYVDLHQRNQVLRYGLTILIAALVFIILQYSRPVKIPAISDIFPRPGSRQVVELDGLRGLAALLVMLEHTWAPFAGAGATGVWLFFILSGYLLGQPFVEDPNRALNPGYLMPYLVRRIGRILPMYIVVILVTFGFNDNAPQMVEHLLFVEATGHFWTIPQELLFYLFLPLFMIIGCLAHRISPRLFFPAMLGICVLLFWKPQLSPIDPPGSRPSYMGWFLLGVVLASMGPFLDRLREASGRMTRHWLGIIGTALLGLLLSASCYGITSVLVMENVTLPVNFPRVFGIIAAMVMLLVLVTPGSLLGYILKMVPLRAIGVVGYSFYLLHPLVIGMIEDFTEKFWGAALQGPRLFVAATIVTWLISLFTYSHVERPFLAKSQPYPASSSEPGDRQSVAH